MAANDNEQHTCRQIYNAAIFLIKERDGERVQAQKDGEEPSQWHTKTELRNKVYGFKNDQTITVGMKNCAEHIKSEEPLETTEELVRDRWNQVPYKMKEDAVHQAIWVLSTNLSKAKKRKERNSKGKIKPFSLGFREYS